MAYNCEVNQLAGDPNRTNDTLLTGARLTHYGGGRNSVLTMAGDQIADGFGSYSTLLSRLGYISPSRIEFVVFIGLDYKLGDDTEFTRLPGTSPTGLNLTNMERPLADFRWVMPARSRINFRHEVNNVTVQGSHIINWPENLYFTDVEAFKTIMQASGIVFANGAHRNVPDINNYDFDATPSILCTDTTSTDMTSTTVTITGDTLSTVAVVYEREQRLEQAAAALARLEYTALASTDPAGRVYLFDFGGNPIDWNAIAPLTSHGIEWVDDEYIYHSANITYRDPDGKYVFLENNERPPLLIRINRT